MTCFVPLFGIVGAILGKVSLSRIRKSEGRLTGSGLAIAGLVIGILSSLFTLFMLLVGAVLVPHLMETSIRRKVARVKADLRTISGGLEYYGIEVPQAPPALKAAADAVRVNNDLRALAAGLDAYSIDCGMIPPSTVKPGSPALPPTFVTNCLTTPVAYLNGMNFSDPYGPVPNTPYRYYASENGKDWILWSAGPDGVYNLTDSNLPPVFNYGGAPSAGLINLSYDPTNGATSAGDIWVSNEGYGN